MEKNILDEGAAILDRGLFRIETPNLSQADRDEALKYFQKVVAVDNKFLRKHLLNGPRIRRNEQLFIQEMTAIRNGLSRLVRFEP